MMSFISFESFHQEILWKLFSVLVSSSLSHPQDDISLKKRANLNNLSIKPLWASLDEMPELQQPFLTFCPQPGVSQKPHFALPGRTWCWILWKGQAASLWESTDETVKGKLLFRSCPVHPGQWDVQAFTFNKYFSVKLPIFNRSIDKLYGIFFSLTSKAFPYV